MRWRRKRLLPAVALLLLIGGCSGSGSGSDDHADPPAPPPVERISFANAVTTTVFPQGAVSFRLQPVLGSNERITCTLNGNENPCPLDGQTGVIRFSNLTAGSYEVAVKITTSAGEPVQASAHRLEISPVDIVVLGATPGGITAAVAAARSGQSVALIERTQWVGGVMSGGLGKTDVGRRGHEIIGGMTAEFFQRVRDVLVREGSCITDCRGSYDVAPRVAERVFEEMLAQAGVIVERSVQPLALVKEGAVIRSIETSGGTVAAQVFVDATYEGDLMAMAGVPYAIGREPRVAGGGEIPEEQNAGATRYRVPLGLYVDPYRTAGDPASGTLPFVEPRPSTLPQEGAGDPNVMAYTYRLCVTDDPSNQIPFRAPENYDPANFEASARVAQALAQSGVNLAERMFNPASTVRSTNSAYMKYDLNGGSTFSIDMTAPDLNQRYAEASETERERIRHAYRMYIEGLLYFWQTDARYGALNQKVSRFGLCRDEFIDRGGWPHQLYVRVARRMIGDYVMSQSDVEQNGLRPAIADPVGFGAYDMDMHTHRYFAGPVNWPDGTRRDAIVIEGFRTERLPEDKPYPISYRSLIPKEQDAANLLNPVTLSATHVAYSSLRMEPTFMILGEAAGVAASIAVEQGVHVKAVPYSELRNRLLALEQRLPN